MRIGLAHPQLRYAVMYGVFNNTRSFFDNETAFKLGYQPRDDAEAFAAAVLSQLPPEDPTLAGTHTIGGWAANKEYTGPLERLREW